MITELPMPPPMAMAMNKIHGRSNTGEGVGRAHGRQGIFPDEAAHDHRIRDVIKLLEQVAEDHWKGKK